MDVKEVLKRELERASKDLQSKELLFTTEWLFDFPSQSLSIAGVMLHEKYSIPTGPEGFGIKDLNILEQEGFLKKIAQSEEDPDTMHQVTTYLLQ